MTDIELEQAENRAKTAKKQADSATEGPWQSYDLDTRLWVVEGPGYYEYPWAKESGALYYMGSLDADFIASARDGVPALATDVIKLVKEIRRLQGIIQSSD